MLSKDVVERVPRCLVCNRPVGEVKTKKGSKIYKLTHDKCWRRFNGNGRR